jgi:hypothetical protein
MTTAREKPKKPICKCGTVVDGLSSYFGVPLHLKKSKAGFESYRVCPSWSGV